MSSLILFGIIFVSAYLVQSFFSMRQIKSFNQTFQEFRKKGKVVVGRKSGRIAAGTVLLFLVDADGTIQDGAMMQGISVFARFKKMEQFNGIKLIDLSPQHPSVKKEIKQTRLAIENGRELYIRFMIGAMQSERYSPISPFGLNVSYAWNKFKMKLNKHRLEENK